MKIEFSYQKDEYRLFDELKIEKWIEEVVKAEKKTLGKIIYEFVSEEQILEINRQFLNHDYFTDIITFDESLVNIIKGHIFISPDTVLTNANNFKCSAQLELYRVIIHGVMHLCGYSDKEKSEEKVMRSKENHYLDKI